MAKEEKYYFGTGRRKTAVARVRIYENPKVQNYNRKEEKIDDSLLKPFEIVGKRGSFGVSIIASGGGKSSQKDAIKLGIARALVQYNPEFRLSLKKADLLTRDPREVERKKPGLKKARRSPQWSKR